MVLNKESARFSKLVDKVIAGMEDVKAENITIYDLRKIDNSVCDFFVVCDGTSNTQVNAISESVEKSVRESLGDKPWHVEGKENGEWVLIDFVDVVAHVFQRQVRTFYDLDSLWSDAAVTVMDDNR